jgi:hypothetical protein
MPFDKIIRICFCSHYPDLVDEREIPAGRRRSIADALKLVPTSVEKVSSLVAMSG